MIDEKVTPDLGAEAEEMAAQLQSAEPILGEVAEMPPVPAITLRLPFSFARRKGVLLSLMAIRLSSFTKVRLILKR